jgi:hypothetical protein
MHPDLLRALAKARHQDLLNKPLTRAQTSIRVHKAVTPRFSRTRLRVGSLLVWAGSRLIGDQQPLLELTHE